jgi:hypothetical protein
VLLASGNLSFVMAMESFELPQLLGTPAKMFVFTTKIYDLAYGGHVANFGPATCRINRAAAAPGFAVPSPTAGRDRPGRCDRVPTSRPLGPLGQPFRNSRDR